MDISVEIEALVANFSFRWYEQKHEQFVDIAKGYDPNTSMRTNKIAGYNTMIDEETGETYSEIAWEDTEVLTIEEFCWLDQERSYEQMAFYPDKALVPVDASILIHELCDKINDFLPKEDVIGSYNIVNNSQNILRVKIDDLLSNNTDVGYEKVCRYISENGSNLIRTIFDVVVQRYIYGESSPDRLEFELNKQQLAALIFLMHEAGFIVERARNERKKYDFFEKYFNWTDSAKDTHHLLIGLRKLMSDFSKGDHGKAVDDVMKMLQRAHNK